MKISDPDLQQALAQRYVLGTMAWPARRRFGRLMDDDPRVADAVYRVEERLLPLAWSLEPAQPSDLIWARISRQLLRPSSSPRRTSQWPLAAVSLALLVAAAGWWQTSQQPPVVETVTETVIEPFPVEPAIGVVEDANGEPLWIARVYADLQRVDIDVRTAPEAQTDADYQLWLLRDDGTPISIGLLPQTGERQVTLTPDALDALTRSETLAVSLEPLGGSPNPVPSGPVLYTAALLAP